MGHEQSRRAERLNRFRRYNFEARMAQQEIDRYGDLETYTPPSMTDVDIEDRDLSHGGATKRHTQQSPDESYLLPKPRILSAAEQAEVVLLDTTMNFARTEYTEEVLDSIIHSAVTLKQ